MAKKPETKPKFKIPDDFQGEADFLHHMRKEFREDTEYDRLNREAALEDLRFTCGDQWDDIARARREAARKPVLTINRLPAFVAQLIGNRRQNETTIRIVPDTGSSYQVAEVREGLIRNIQKVSRAEVAYDKAFEGSVVCGIGNFAVDLDYTSADVFEQDIGVVSIPDHLSVLWDRKMLDGTGRDADHCFRIHTMSEGDFHKQWPWATPADVQIDTILRGDLRMNGWIAAADVRVVEYWVMRTEPRTLGLLKTGAVVDITDKKGDLEFLSQVVSDQEGSPIVRDVERPYAQMYLCSGQDILEGPYDLPIDRVPLFRVPGWEISVGQWKHRWGLVRFLKDPQRLHNYWRSVIAEKLMLTPRAGWIAKAEAVAGREADWRNSHLSDDPLLIYNGEAGEAPVRVQAAEIQQALMTEAELTTQDIKDVSNIHEANLGMPSNEVSGAAITARQRVSDTGTVIYHDNLNMAIEEAGRVINTLIDIAYDTPRVIKVLGEDAQDAEQVINDFGNPDSVDITEGKYLVTVVTGPSYATQRAEGATAILHIMQTMPQTAQYLIDLFAENLDIPGANKIAKRARAMMPPQILEDDEVTPQMKQRAQTQAQAQAQAQALAAAGAQAKISKDQADATLSEARAQNFSVEAGLAPQHADIAAATAQSQIQERELSGHLEAIKTAEAV